MLSEAWGVKSLLATAWLLVAAGTFGRPQLAVAALGAPLLSSQGHWLPSVSFCVILLSVFLFSCEDASHAGGGPTPATLSSTHDEHVSFQIRSCSWVLGVRMSPYFFAGDISP